MMQVFIANIFYLSFLGGVFYVIYVTFSCLYISCVSLFVVVGGGCVGFAGVVLLFFLVVSVWCAWCSVVVVFLM